MRMRLYSLCFISYSALTLFSPIRDKSVLDNYGFRTKSELNFCNKHKFTNS